MSERRPSLARAIKTVQGLGLPVAAVEFDPNGTIRVLTQAPAKPEPTLSALEQWERENGLGAA